MVVRIGIRIARNLGDRIQRALRRRVVAQHAIALAHLFEGPDGVRLGPRPVPHLFAFYEKRVPVIVVRVRGEDPVASLSSCCCHRGRESAELYTVESKKRNKM